MDILQVSVLAFLSVWLWNEIFLRFARRLGALSQGIPNQRRWDSRKKPIIGGIGFFLVILGLGAWHPEGLTLSRSFLAGASIAFLTGLADDAFVAVPYLKLMGQLAAACTALLLGAPLLEVGFTPLSIALTLFWYVAVMNALNMMDNMDGIAGSLSLMLLLGSFWLVPHSPHKLLYIGLAAGIIAFLLRNWYPSHLYMGDNGSQLLGFVLAYWGTEVWQNQPTLLTLEKLLGLVSLFALLAGDTFWVIISRLHRKQIPWNGGTDHLTHRLAQWGWPARTIALAILLIQAALTSSTLLWSPSTDMVWVSGSLIVFLGSLIGGVHLVYLHRTSRAISSKQLV